MSPVVNPHLELTDLDGIKLIKVFSGEIKCCVFLCHYRLEEILEAAEDTAIDIPHIWLYLAELITPMLHEGGIPMGQLFR